MKPFIPTKLARLSGSSVIAVTLLAAGFLSAADPQSKPARQGAGAARLTGMSPTEFIKEAAQGNAAELALSQVAQSRAQKSQVRQFAEQMVRDHQQAMQQLAALVQAYGISTNEPLAQKHQKKLDDLRKLSGEEFDQEYMRVMLRDHQEMIASFGSAARSDDPRVRQYAESTLPELRLHIEHAKRVARAAGLDDATIAALSREPAEARGGTADRTEQDVGGAAAEPGRDVRHPEHRDR